MFYTLKNLKTKTLFECDFCFVRLFKEKMAVGESKYTLVMSGPGSCIQGGSKRLIKRVSSFNMQHGLSISYVLICGKKKKKEEKKSKERDAESKLIKHWKQGKTWGLR